MLLGSFTIQRRIIGLIIFFLLAGQIALFSATAVMGIQKHSSEFYYVIRQSSCALLGLLLMWGVAQVPYLFWKKISYWLLGGQLILVAATHIAPFKHFAYGATRWLKLGPVLFQPSELAKITITIFCASILARHKESPLVLKKWIANGIPVLIILGLIFKQPDLGTTTILVAVLMGMFFISGVRLSYLISFLGLGSLGFVFAIVQHTWRRQRLFAYLNPWADPQGTGFQTIQSFLSFHSGKLFGTGLGNGNSKLFFLPEVHTDFIFATFSEQWGFLGSSLLILIYYLIIRQGFIIAQRTNDTFGRLLAYGISILLAIQVFINIAMNMGLAPVVGLPLPMMSYGGSSMLVTFIALGILVNIDRTRNVF